jgi:hypothetical protein
MDEDVRAVREAIEAFRADEAMERVRRARGVADADDETTVARRHRRLASEDALAVLGQAARELSNEEHAALRAHLARARADVALAQARSMLAREALRALVVGRHETSPAAAFDELARTDVHERRLALFSALEARIEEAAPALAEARADADREGLTVLRGGAAPMPSRLVLLPTDVSPPGEEAPAAAATKLPDAGPSADELRDRALACLAATDALVEDAVPFALSRVEGASRDLGSLVRALRAREQDGLVRRDGRFRRIAEDLGALGFERDLAARVAVHGTHDGLLPRTRLALVRVPGDVRILESKVELGVASELAAMEGLGRALGFALTAPALPIELRRPLAGSVARAIGVLFAQLLGDRAFLAGARSLGRRERDELGRRAALLLVLEARVHAAAIAARARARDAEARAEEGAALLARALGVHVPLAVARLVVVAPAALGPRFRARVAGLALGVAMRDRFDEDWYRNPRAAEPIRAAAARGALASAEDWLHELGGSADMAAPRLFELFG